MSDAGISLKHVTVNGLDLAYLESGQGPLVLLLHGFPDDAWTWSHQIPVLTEAGYRVVAPFLRGYPPSAVPAPGGCNSKNNAEDVVALLRVLTDEPAYVVGHDWGGLATYGALSMDADLIRRATVLAVSHPATLLASLEKPALIHQLFHVWFFQLEEFSEGALRAKDFGLLEYIWDLWTRDGHDETEHVAHLKRDVFSQPGVVETLVPYYRALVRFPKAEPAFVEALLRPTTVPMLSIWGADDPGQMIAEGERGFFQGEYRRENVPDARHFVHREQPTKVNELLLAWLDDGNERVGEPVHATRAR